MGQALRRAVGRVPNSARTRPSPPQSMSRNPEELPKPAPDGEVAFQDHLGVSSTEDTSKAKVEDNILEERDPKYDVMLQKMVGTIRSKPGGKLEMGEAFIVEKYKRPLPKIRSSKVESESHGEKPVPPGTLTIVQVQEIMRLHQTKSADQNGQMSIQNIAQKYGVDATHVEKMVQFISLPSGQQEKGSSKSN